MNKNNDSVQADKPIKIVILGGGPASLAAAFELSDPAQKNKYDITVYQLGWRLGGKCASGRNRDISDRVQEHGLHVFLGSYVNTFDILNRAYEAIPGSTPTPFRSWEMALEGADHLGLAEFIDGEWKPWLINLPTMPGKPLQESDENIFSIAGEVLHFSQNELGKHSRHFPRKLTIEDPDLKLPWWCRLIRRVFFFLEKEVVYIGRMLLRSAITLLHELSKMDERLGKELGDALVGIFRKLHKWFGHILPDKLEDGFRHWIIIIDFTLTNILGGLIDGLFFDQDASLPEVNKLDYREWLAKHGALDITINSAIVRSLYDLIFAYPDGDVTREGKVEAGTMFVSLTKTCRYRGNFFWKMKAGTGDVFATPLYEAMKARGVKFKFFHRVTELEPSPDGSCIEKVVISRQVTLRAGEYDPFYRQKNGLNTWPSEPNYDQIVEGPQLEKENIDLESRWTSWKDTGGVLELEKGRDFDSLILGTSIEPLHYLCDKLKAQKKSWQDMLDNLQTVQTQCVQCWFKLPLNGNSGNCINPELADGVLLGAYDRNSVAFDTLGDISEILEAEDWPANTVGNVSILCGPMKGPVHPPDSSKRGFPATCAQEVNDSYTRYVGKNGELLWPGLYDQGVFKQRELVSEYQRANIDPSERYVLTLPNTSIYRLRTQDSGYSNLFLAGDWIQNGHNLGSIEGSIMSGRMASKAISGLPATVHTIPPDSKLYR